MNFKELIESLKSNFLEIIGYLLPGFITYILLVVSINSSYKIDISRFLQEEQFDTFIIIAVCYSMGYVIFGIGKMKDEILNEKSYTKKILKGLNTKSFFTTALAKFNKHLEAKSVPVITSPTFTELRSQIMGFLSEEERSLIYTFMFRADFSNHLYNICSIVGILGVVNFVLYKLISFEEIFLLTTIHILLYIFLLLSGLFLRKTRNYFYDKAMRTPFNMYNSK